VPRPGERLQPWSGDEVATFLAAVRVATCSYGLRWVQINRDPPCGHHSAVPER
jgi:hypothetical protein